MFDTSIASAFLGSAKLGLAAVLKEHLGIELTKTKSMQRSDWTRRPLSSESLEYAADDVLHLAALRDELAANLAKLSRLEWVQEECERLSRVRSQPPDPDWAFLSVKGRSGLDPRGLAVLRSLHRFREQEALRRNTPPFKIIPKRKSWWNWQALLSGTLPPLVDWEGLDAAQTWGVSVRPFTRD